MKSDPLAQVTSALEKAIADSGDVEASPAGRDEAIARIADALRRRRSASRKRRFAFVAAAAAIAIAAGTLASRRGETAHAPVRTSDEARIAAIQSGLTAIRNGQEAAPAPGERLGDGTELRTPPSAEANLEFDTGSQLAVGAASRVRLVEQARRKRFALETGSLRAKVAKLAPDERFVVTTRDSEIEVRGTEFRIAVVEPDSACGDGTPTRVEVTEGVVVVRHAGVEERIAAGEHWPRCAAPARSAEPAAPPSVPRVVKPAPSASVAPASSASRLAEQNDLFETAMRKKRGGDPKGALEALDRLRTDYADGPLSEGAEVERFRILAGVDRARAAAAARDYLRAHPRGFARAEAEALTMP